MGLYSRLAAMLKEDFGALIPGTDVPFTGETIYRLLVYLALGLFCFVLLSGIGERTQGPVFPGLRERRAPQSI